MATLAVVTRDHFSGIARRVVIEQLLPTTSDGVRVQLQETGRDGIAAVTQPNGFQADEHPAVLFVKQAVEQQNSGLEFVRRNEKPCGVIG